MKIKYQIFVSSTYEDLRDERELVIKAILEMGHIPVGMEMFSAGDEEQWKLIQRQIEDCDYYVVIAAHRYGSMDGPTSYTEKEHDYATSKGIPCLGFVISDKAEWPINKSDTDTERKSKLDFFKEKINQSLDEQRGFIRKSFNCTNETIYSKSRCRVDKSKRISWTKCSK
jgi:hypothetical protein